ncbi:MAG: PorV/PorQ family protein [Candidatus Krumholzibacteriota bacterium]|nr:PorV/PorQ family protein [Candidatus Krumholzibacteriota bacterium]
MIRRTLIVISVLAALCPAARAGEPGTAGFVFLRLGNGARAAGMGEAFTAVADDATGLTWNPAGLAAVEGIELNLSHSEWIADIRFEQVSVASEMFGGTVGFNFTGLYYGDMDRYGQFPTLTPDGTFAPYDLAASVGYARDVLPNLAVGLAAKLIYEKIDFESATGWAVDIGVAHRTMIEGLSLAASLLNFGPQAKFVEEKFYPPIEMRVGASYRRDDARLRGALIVATDAVIENDSEDLKLHVGAEYTYRRIVSVRVGYKGNYYVQGATLGLGVRYDRFRFDYAYLPIEFDLGDSHRFSLSIFPGRP